MKRVTILLDDDQLYRDLKAAAAHAGRPVKDVVAEAFGDWLAQRSGRISPEAQRRRQQAILAADESRTRLSAMPRGTAEVLREIRDERARGLVRRNGDRQGTPGDG